MLINTINVSSWLMLSALVPSSLPEIVKKQYSQQFVTWPPINSAALTQQLFSSLKILRFVYLSPKIRNELIERCDSKVVQIVSFQELHQFAAGLQFYSRASATII